ncbi:MAG: MBL fold metallo-hydrolase [Oscillospiraceae bacterium]|nr:MBL fold metallo-hydrolase [Oscillospiraceae bacterium]
MIIQTVIVGGIKTNCYIVADPETRNCAVIDPGAESKRLLSHLSEHGMNVKYIFITHGHFDHIGAVAGLRAQTGAKVAVHEADAPCLTDPARSHARVNAGTPDITAADGSEFTVDGLTFKWLNTPGHTEGSCVILCGGAMFTGDTLFYEECGRCDLPGGDYSKMLASLGRLAALDGDYDVYPGHGEPSKLSHERGHNPYVGEALAK